MDQLGPKALRAQGENENLTSADILSYSSILISTPVESLSKGEVETKTGKEDVKRSIIDW